MRGRVRFRVPALRGDGRLRRALEAGLGGNGIRSVNANSRTGSVLVLFDPARPLAEIERRVREVATRKPDLRSAAIASDGPDWHAIDAAAAIRRLGSRIEGLSTATAAALARRHGPNMLVKIERRSGFEILLDQFRSLPVALLAGTAVLSLLTGGALDAAIVAAVIVLNGVIGFVSERWTEETIASLERSELPPAHVLRDGSEAAVPVERLVPGDVIVVRHDDVVPADARVIAADRLTVNEAGLTGESIPVAKAGNVLATVRAPIAERRNMLFRGSVVTGGSGRAVVVATGDHTEIARVQALLGSAARPETPLQEQLDRLGRLLVVGAFAASGLMLLIGLARGRSLLVMLRAAVSLGVAAVPEGFPTMVTTTLAYGTRRLARHGLLVRRLEAIEALGSIRLVCFDKTGTLTLNRMSVTRLVWNGCRARLTDEAYRDGSGRPVACDADPDLARLLEICVLCNDAVPRGAEAPGGFDGSATEAALLEAAARLGFDVTAMRRQQPRLAVVERAVGRRYMATVHPAPDGRRLVAVKGDPQAVLARCRGCMKKGERLPLDPALREAVDADNLAMAKAGLRVLGVACRMAEADGDLADPASDLTWLGLVGMADPIRPGAAAFVRKLQQAGIETVMLTGDQRATAVAIAAEAGLAPAEDAQVVEGDDIDSGPVMAGSHRIFARLTPEQKLRVITGLQRAGMRVAMIGDGVNDTPALKAADVGITLAASATSVARDVADIVLTGDDLLPLLNAFESGRSVHRNIRRAARYLIATNLSEILLMLFATGTDLVRPLTPGQLLWLNLLTDVLPAMGLALDPPEPGSIAAPAPASPVLSRADIGRLVRDAGVIATSAVIAERLAPGRRGNGGAGVGFAGLVAAQLLYALACGPRPGRLPGPVTLGALAASFAAQGAALLVPGLRRVAGGSLGLSELSVAGAAGLAPLLLIGALDNAAGPLNELRPAR